jgi:hypothetical protein
MPLSLTEGKPIVKMSWCWSDSSLAPFSDGGLQLSGYALARRSAVDPHRREPVSRRVRTTSGHGLKPIEERSEP